MPTRNKHTQLHLLKIENEQPHPKVNAFITIFNSDVIKIPRVLRQRCQILENSDKVNKADSLFDF